MKKLLFIILIQLVVSAAIAQTAVRVSEEISAKSWKVSWQTTTTTKLNQVIETLSNASEVHLNTLANIAQDYDAVFLRSTILKDGTTLKINGQTVNIEQSTYIPITDYVNFEEDTMEIILPNQKYSEEDLMVIMDSFTLEYFRGAGIVYATASAIEYAEGYQLNVHLSNFSPSDLDGKLYASILNPEDYSVVAENNNCAFLFSGMNPVIEIPFYELKVPNKQQTYLVELKLVDKQNDEEISDEWSSTILF